MYSYQVSDDLVLGFSTPVLVRKLKAPDSFREQLRELILEKEKTDEGMKRSNRNGWHSQTDLLKWEDPVIETLRRRFFEVCRLMTARVAKCKPEVLEMDARFSSWANVNRDGGYNTPHDHPSCTWSGVYYVNLGNPTEGISENGVLKFIDPRTNVDILHHFKVAPPNKFVVTPEQGMVVVFPHWLRHFVTPFHGEGERISIAFNCTIMRLVRTDRESSAEDEPQVRQIEPQKPGSIAASNLAVADG